MRIRSFIIGWQNWRMRRAIRKAVPGISEACDTIAKCRKAHSTGARRAMKAAQDALNRQLARELGREWK